MNAKTIILLMLAVFAFSCSAFGATEQQAADTKPGHHLHDGFFLRMAPGFAANQFFAEGEKEGEYSDPYVVSAGSNFNFMIGGCLFENLALHLTIWNNSPFSKLDGTREDLDVWVDASAMGAGVTYYLMPLNFYFTGSFGGSRLGWTQRDNTDIDGEFTRYDDEDDDEDDDLEYLDRVGYGVALDFMFGKEWWVSSNWGLGVAGVINYYYTKSKYLRWNNLASGVVFSATFN